MKNVNAVYKISGYFDYSIYDFSKVICLNFTSRWHSWIFGVCLRFISLCLNEYIGLYNNAKYNQSHKINGTHKLNVTKFGTYNTAN